MVGMVFHLCQVAGTQLETGYKRRMMGVGPSYRERQRVRVQCSECREDMVLGLLELYLQTQNGEEMGDRWHWGTTPPGGDPRTYNMAFLTARDPRN